ncbi:MAG: beta-lactamase hydrolase domain-containing protein [Erythrobacter sp.]
MDDMPAGDPADIRNWRRRPDGITTSGRLEPQDPARLAAVGVSHVVNLALDNHPEALADEAARLAEHGIGYTHIPVPFDAPSREHVSALRDVLAREDGPVHVHCIMNWRVTAFMYLLDREAGVPEPEARARLLDVWDPFTSDNPASAPWRELLAGER